jgi:uncharacterized protein
MNKKCGNIALHHSSMVIIGFLAAILIGLSLGLIGGGGSILTVPVLVYLFAVDPLLATSYSLFIVGTTSLIGAISNYRKGLVNLSTALLFGISSITTVFLTRKFIIPLIPTHIATIWGFEITDGLITMLLFAVLMVMASLSMIKNGMKDESAELKSDKKIRFISLTIYGILIGIVTGLLGAGGGFLLIPTLVIVVGLPMKEAVGTSLMIIAMNSLIGFTGDIAHFNIDWRFLLEITAMAVSGIIIGGLLARKIKAGSLKKFFGWFVLVMGIYIIIKEMFFL